VAGAETPPVTEALVLRSASPERVVEFARQYNGGYMKFEADFQKQFVERIQGPAPADSLFGRLFGAPPNSADAFRMFGPYTIREFTELANTNETELAAALAREQIDMQDYLAWKGALAEWQRSGLVINPGDRFADVAEAAFINSLNQPSAA